MKSKMAAAGVAFALAATALGLAAGPASAASGPQTTATIERLPAHALATLKIPYSEGDTCLAASESPTLTAATRLNWCAVFDTGLTVTLKGKVVGTATIEQLFYASWKVSSRTWKHNVQTYLEVDSTGDLKGQPLAVSVVNSCAGGCHVTSNRTYGLHVPVTPAPYTKRDVGVESTGTATVTGTLTASWTYAAIGLVFPPVSKTTVGVRCDSEEGYKYPAGCANPSFTPTYVLSSARYPAIAKFDKAEIAKHPSWGTLTRVSPAQKKANRKVACKGFHPPKPYSCDEFPYASTIQGGKGAAVQKVLASENLAQGGNLVGFYNANRLHYNADQPQYGEKFHVKVS